MDIAMVQEALKAITGVIKNGLLSRRRKEALYHIFMEEVLKETFYCAVKERAHTEDERDLGKICYLNASADFSSYTRSKDPAGFHGRELRSLLEPSNWEVPSIKEMAHRRERPTKNAVLREIREEHPKLYGEIKVLFERGWCYRFEIQKAFGVKITEKNPYIL